MKDERILNAIAADREKYLDKIEGCLIGGAADNALGYPVECM